MTGWGYNTESSPAVKVVLPAPVSGCFPSVGEDVL